MLSVNDPIIRNILERLAIVERHSKANAEILQPNYLTTSPSGLVGANFSGVINASGLFLPEGQQATGFYTAPSAVQWNDTLGNVQEFIQGHTFNNNHILDLIAGTPTEWSNSQVAYVELLNQLPFGNYQQITVRTGNPFNQLLDSNNKSDWLRIYLATPQAGYLLAGFNTLTWNGASAFTPAVAVTTMAFNSVAQCVVGNEISNNGLAVGIPSATFAGGNPAVFNLVAFNQGGGTPGAGTTWNVYWIAMGW